MSKFVVFCTTPSAKVARKIAKRLLEKNLIACVNIVSNLSSIYKWKNEICIDKEALMIIKTSKKRLKKLEDEIIKFHPYDTPEIIALKIKFGNAKYLKWIKNTTKGNKCS